MDGWVHTRVHAFLPRKVKPSFRHVFKFPLPPPPPKKKNIYIYTDARIASGCIKGLISTVFSESMWPSGEALGW